MNDVMIFLRVEDVLADPESKPPLIIVNPVAASNLEHALAKLVARGINPRIIICTNTISSDLGLPDVMEMFGREPFCKYISACLLGIEGGAALANKIRDGMSNNKWAHFAVVCKYDYIPALNSILEQNIVKTNELFSTDNIDYLLNILLNGNCGYKLFERDTEKHQERGTLINKLMGQWSLYNDYLEQLSVMFIHEEFKNQEDMRVDALSARNLRAELSTVKTEIQATTAALKTLFKSEFALVEEQLAKREK